MKVLMKLTSLVTTLVLGLTGTAAFAQSANTGWYVAPTAGITLNDSNRNKNTGGAVGLAIGKVLNEKWNLAASTSGWTVKMTSKAISAWTACTFSTATPISHPMQ